MASEALNYLVIGRDHWAAAGTLVKGYGCGMIGNVVVGIVGAFVRTP
jgi:uncharacterized membrane protein YeaQ/YmgE (transglycosylase-associated protein family)